MLKVLSRIRRATTVSLNGIHLFSAVAICGLALLGLSIPAEAQFQPKREKSHDMAAIADRMNANTLLVMTGNPGFIYSEFGNDLAAVLNNDQEVRILPIISQGGIQNVRDLRFLKGVDIGFSATNYMAFVRRSGEIPDLTDKIVYICRISIDHVNVIVRSNITSLEQLRGKKVNFNSKGSGTQMTGHDVFGALNIPVEEVNLGPADAFEQLKTGEIAATILTSGAPASVIKPLKASDGYRLLPVPLVGQLMEDYVPASLTNADYPDLIPPGKPVDTIAVSSVLIAYNWPKDSDRYQRIEKFTRLFFAKFDEFLKPPRNPKWRETNIFAAVRGWKRFDGAEAALSDIRAQMQANQRQQADQGQLQHTGALSQANGRSLSEGERNQLFQDFLKWSSSH
jgi:TRAP transporter TAXI family solute receptor